MYVINRQLNASNLCILSSSWNFFVVFSRFFHFFNKCSRSCCGMGLWRYYEFTKFWKKQLNESFIVFLMCIFVSVLSLSTAFLFFDLSTCDFGVVCLY